MREVKVLHWMRYMPRRITLQKTAIFQLHNLSAAKRRVLDLALERYGDAYNLMLERCHETANKWVSERVEGKRAYPLTPFTAAKEIRPLFPSSEELNLSSALRDGLLSDLAGNLVSYCELRQSWEQQQRGEESSNEPKYPEPLYGYRPGQYEETLAQVAAWAGESFDFKEFQSHLLKEARQAVHPLFYVRLHDFGLEQLNGDHWGARLQLQPKGCNPTKLHFPLAFGERHEQEYLTKGKPRCARLARRDGEYYLHVSFEFQVEAIARGEQECYLGIDRGILKQAAYALVSLDGTILHKGSLGRELRTLQVALGRRRQARQRCGRRIGAKHWQRRHQEELLHQIANEIVGLAASHRALVVMERLELQTAGAFIRSQYAKLAKMLDYKLRLAALLPPIKVFAAYSSLICCGCGGMGTREARDRETLHCGECGAILDADENAAVNIARRALYCKANWEDCGGYRAFHRSFASVG